MLLIVKNENWFQLLNRGCLSVFVRSSLKALSLCQEIIRKNLLCKPSTWNMSKPHQDRATTPCLVADHSKVDTKSSSQIRLNWISIYRYDEHCDDVTSAFICAPGSELSIHKCTASLKLAMMLFFYPPSPHTGAAFEPLQMLVRARKSMHSNRDKMDLVWITQDILVCIIH